MKGSKIPRQVLILSLISFFTDFASEMLYPVVPLFLTAALGASMSIVGIIEGFAEIIAGLLKGYAGALSDKIGKRAVFIRFGYGLSAFVKSLPGILPHISTVVFSRSMDRVGKGLRTAPRDALLSFHSKGNSGAIFGFHRGADTFGAVVGPLIAILLLSLFPSEYTLIFIIAFIPSVFAIFFTLKVKDPPNSSKIAKKKLYREFWKNASREYKFLLIIISVFSLVNSSDVFLILKSKYISGSDTTAIFGYVFYNLIYALLSYPLGILSDKWGKKNVFVFGLLIFAAVYFGFGLIENFLFVWVLFAFYGIFSASTEGIIKAWASDIIPDNFIGSGIGLLTLVMSFSVMIGSVLTGILWDLYGSRVPFLLSGFVSLAVALILIFYSPKK